MSEEGEDIEELIAIARKMDGENRALIMASARAVLFGEQAVKRQYGLSPEWIPGHQTEAGVRG